MNFQDGFTVAAAAGFLILKLHLARQVGIRLAVPFSLDPLSAFVAGWVGIYAVLIGVILLLSAFDALSAFSFSISILVLVVVESMGLLRRSPQMRFDASLLRNPAFWAIGAIVLLLGLRSAYFYDFTWDAQTYGLPRLVIWWNAGSVFTHAVTPQLNLFVNEWNADLNALAYGLFSNAYAGFAFGNVEIFVLLCVATFWILRSLSLARPQSLAATALLASSPALVALASTIKGDLLAIVAFLMAVGWCLRLRQRADGWSFVLCVACGALAVGAKISVAIPVVALTAYAIHAVVSRGGFDSPIRPAMGAAGVAALMLFSSRFMANWWTYGSPLVRVGGEQARFAWRNGFANLHLMGQQLFGTLNNLHRDGPAWALAADLGVVAWFIFALVLIAAFRWIPIRRKQGIPQFAPAYPMRSMVGLLAVVVLATFASMTLVPSLPWSMRYFAPGLVFLLIAVCAWSWRATSNPLANRAITLLCAVGVVANIGLSIRVGELIPVIDRAALVTELAQTGTPLKRIGLFVKGPMLFASIDALHLDSAAPKNLLVFQDVDLPLIPFLGSHAQNRIRLTPDVERFIAEIPSANWDAVVLIRKKADRDRGLISRIEALDYFVVVDNDYYLIALSRAKVAVKEFLTIRDFNWSLFGARPGVVLSTDSNAPSVESALPVDAGLVSQQLDLGGPVVLRASFEGSVASVGPHAAHLSLHGVSPVVLLPSGVYSEAEVFRGVLPIASKAQPLRLSFGLGGWGTGSGYLRLKQLSLFRLEFKEDAEEVR